MGVAEAMERKKVDFRFPICGKVFHVSCFERDRTKIMGLVDFCLHNCDVGFSDCVPFRNWTEAYVKACSEYEEKHHENVPMGFEWKVAIQLLEEGKC